MQYHLDFAINRYNVTVKVVIIIRPEFDYQEATPTTAKLH